MGYFNDVFLPGAKEYWDTLDVGGSIERGIERTGQFMTHSLPGALIDFFGGSSRWSFTENYLDPPGGASQNPDIYINADSIQQNIGNAQAVAPVPETAPAPVQEVAPAQEIAPAPQQSAEDWFHAAREAEILQARHQEAQFEALNQSVLEGTQQRAAELRAGEDIGAGREQNLAALAVDPLGHYAQQDSHAAADAAWYADRQAQEDAYWQMRAAMDQQHEQEHEQRQSLSR